MTTYTRRRLVALFVIVALWVGSIFAGIALADQHTSDRVPSYLSNVQREAAGLPLKGDPEEAPQVSVVAPVSTEVATPKSLRDVLWAPLLEESQEQRKLVELIAYAQDTASAILDVCPDAPRENVKIASQEWAILKALHPDHSAIKQRKRCLIIIKRECTFRPPCVTPPYSAASWAQIIKSTAVAHQYDHDRLCGSTEDDLRYGLRCFFDLLTGDQWQHWVATDPGRVD